MEIRKTLSKLTIEEKAALVSGTDFMYTNSVPRLGIPSVRMSDGPHGLRVQKEGGDNGVNGSEPATAFPTAVSTASSWNPENTYKMGKAIAEECLHYGVNVLLGPGACWTVENGEYELQLCSDCRTVRLSQTVAVISGHGANPYSDEINELYANLSFEKVTDAVFENMSGVTITVIPPKKPIRLESRFTDMQQTFMGRILYNAVLGVTKKDMKKAKKLPAGAERDNKIKGAMFLKRILESNSIMFPSYKNNAKTDCMLGSSFLEEVKTVYLKNAENETNPYAALLYGDYTNFPLHEYRWLCLRYSLMCIWMCNIQTFLRFISPYRIANTCMTIRWSFIKNYKR